jgi:hypothetical protein
MITKSCNLLAKKMPRRFLAPYPIFGTKNKRLPVGYQKRSPYYWWWQFLRRNAEYVECCERVGKGKHAALYKDFGDVRDDDFHKWWTTDQRGPNLFAENYGAMKLVELDDKSQWQDEWSSDEVMILAVPLSSSKRYLQSRFARLLKERHTSSRGRPTKGSIKSNAKYKIARNYTVQNLEKTLDVYDEYMRNMGKKPKVPLWQIGENLTLIPKAMTSPKNFPAINAAKRNTMGSCVKRYLNSADKIIEGVLKGSFPAI